MLRGVNKDLVGLVLALELVTPALLLEVLALMGEVGRVLRAGLSAQQGEGIGHYRLQVDYGPEGCAQPNNKCQVVSKGVLMSGG